MAVFWGQVKTDTWPEAVTVEQTKLLYPIDNGERLIATQLLEQGCYALREIKDIIKQYEDKAEELEAKVSAMMGEHSEIVTIEGKTLVSWKTSKPSKRFNADLFKSAMPDIYEQFVIEQAGSRRFLVKG
jgi:predicted phage-related endonuclease